MIEYPQNKHIPDEYIIAKLSEFWNEDMPKGDLATECTVSKKTPIKAEIQVLEELVFVGKEIIEINLITHLNVFVHLLKDNGAFNIFH